MRPNADPRENPGTARSPTAVARSIQLAREGRPEVLGELLDVYRSYLRVLAGGGLHRDVRGKADASDVVQETLFKAHQHFHQFRGATEGEWISWIRQILANSLADLHRRFSLAGHDVERETSLESVLDRSSVVLRQLGRAAGPSPGQAAEQRELSVVLADALAQLDPEDGEVIVLRNLKELGWNEIAELTQRSPDAARMRWTRALQRLGPILRRRMP